MGSKFLSTKLATDWPHKTPENGPLGKVFRALLPNSNPGYEGRMHRINRWLIEIDSSGLPNREIGLDTNNDIVVAGPSDRDYGYWCDTNMTESDLSGEEILALEFETYWSLSTDFRGES